MKRFNFDEFLWFIILIILNLSIIYLIFTGKINFYIGKKMIKYTYITIVMISIIAIFQFKNIFTPKGSNTYKRKLLPIMLTLILGVISINKQETFKHIELNKILEESNVSNMDRQSLYEEESDYNLIGNKNNMKSKDESTKENLETEISATENNKQETLIVNENNSMILEDIRVNPQKYIGRKLEINGFVCKENYLNENQFIIGRIVMTCCAADSKVVGIIAEYNRSYDLSENENIMVKGTISSSIIKDDNNASHSIPIIIIDNLERENNL